MTVASYQSKLARCSLLPAVPFAGAVAPSGSIMVSRRDFVGISAGAAAALGLTPQLLHARQQAQILKRAILSTGEMIPVIGLGGSATVASVARESNEDHVLKAGYQMMADKRATVIDTALRCITWWTFRDSCQSCKNSKPLGA